MEIGPIDQGAQVPADPDRVQRAHDGPGHEPEEAADSVEISLKARGLLAQTADESLAYDAKTVSSRLELMREKVASGHYDRPEIIEAVADKLADQMY